MKNDISNVKLVKGPIANDNHNKEKTSIVDLNCRRKKYYIVEAISLSVPLSY